MSEAIAAVIGDADFFRGILDSIQGMGLAVTRPDGMVMWWNAAAQRLTGITQREAVGRYLADLLDSPEASLRNVDEMVRRGPLGVRFPGCQAGSQPRRLQLRASPLPDQVKAEDLRLVQFQEEDARTPALSASDAALDDFRPCAPEVRLINALAEGVVYQSRDGTIVRCNRSAERILGLTADQICGRSSVDPRWKATREDGREFPGELHPAMETLRTGKPCVDVVMGIVRPDGHHIWISINTLPLKDEDEREPHGVVSSFFDITRRKQAEDELRKTSELLRAVSEGTTDAMFVKDCFGRYLHFNQAAAQFVGKSIADVLGRDDTHLFDDASAKVVMARDRRIMLTGMAETEEETITAAGITRTYLATKAPFRDEHGRLRGVIGVSRDITDRIRAEQIVRENEERYRLLLDSIPACISYVDQAERYQWVNRAYQQWFQLPREAIIGRTVQEIEGARNYQSIKECISQALQGRMVRRESHRYLPNGAQRICDAHYIPQRHGTGAVHGFYELVFDRTAERETAETLRASEEKYRKLFETCGDAIFILDMDGRIRAANPAAAKMHGYTLDELLQLSMHDLDAPNGARQIPERLAQLRQGATLHFEVEHLRSTGDVFPMEVVATALELGDEQYVLAFDRDISERKKAERSLRLTQFSIDRAVDSIFWVGPDGTILYANDMACRTLGYQRDELIGRTVPEIDPNFPASAWPDHWEEVKRRKTFSFESDHITKCGNVINTEVTVNYLQYEGREYNCATMRDITHKKQTEEERDRLWNQSPDPLCVAEMDGRLKQVNPTWTRILGWTGDELLSTTWLDLVHPDDRDATWAAQERLRRGEQVTGFEHRCRCKDASYRWFSWNAIPVPASQIVYGFVRDVTEHKMLLEQLQQSQKMEAVGRLAGGVAHDFNNLLTVINGYAEILLSKLSPDDGRREPLTAILGAGERAASLTEQLLAFSRKAIIEPKLLDLNQLIDGSVRMLARLIGEDVALITALEPNLDQVNADPNQLEQVIMNLVVNARDAMPRGGRITLSTNKVTLAMPGPRGNDLAPGDYAQLSVTDSGHGIAAEELDKVFEPFYTTKPTGQGTGLGLSVVHGVIRQLGGTVHVTSQVGVGTTFTILLPMAKIGPRATHGPAVPIAATGHETVLLVEDEVAVRKITRLTLETQGYQVLEASCGGEAIQIVQSHQGPIDLLVTDVVMPDVSGRSLADTVRRLRPGLRVLFMSGYTDDSILRHGVETSSDAFLHKPFNRLALTQAVRGVLDSPSPCG